MPISHQELAYQNPWWQNKNAIHDDFKIKQFKESQAQYIHPVVTDNYEPFSLFIIRGPRQVGKSTALKLLIRRLLSDGSHPFSIFFFDCEMLFTASEIKEMLDAYFNFIELMNYNGNTYILLDEITSVTDWTKIIKFLVDSGRFQHSVVFLTGSNAIDLQRGADRLPGRKGYGTECVMLPISFREYVKLRDLELEEKISPIVSDSFSLTDISHSCKALLPYADRFNKLMNAYLISGGFPQLINAFLSDVQIPQQIYANYLSWIRGDIAKQLKDERRGLQILTELQAVMSSRIGWDNIAKKIGGISHHTIEDHIGIFEGTFLGKTVYQFDFHKRHFIYRKTKKFYFLDNLIYFIIRGVHEKWNNIFQKSLELIQHPSECGKLMEQLVGNHLMRLPGDYFGDNLGFFSNKSEIDFLLLLNNDIFPVEVKYQQTISELDFLPFKKLGFRKGLVLTKETFMQHDDFVAVPISQFLSVLNV
jgi:predicted AAA+ superfamily ATPase